MPSDYLYMSLGAGVQSSAMYILAEQGEIPRPEVAIFADTGDEPPWVYDQIDTLRSYGKIPIMVCKTGVLSDHIAKSEKTIHIPAFIDSDSPSHGMLFRTCTDRFKIRPITRLVKRLMGYKLRDRMTRNAICQLGISMDELQRMKPNPEKWACNVFPLIDLRLNRESCRKVVMAAGLPEPQKSACVY